MRQVKHIIETHLTKTERAALRPWLLARFDVQGYARRGLELVPETVSAQDD